MKALGCEGSSPPSVPSWLDSLGLQDYVHSFLSSGYSSIDSVRNLWELELVNVSAAAWACAARCPLPWAAACLVGAPWARPPPDCCLPQPPGPQGSPARPSEAHHRLPRRQALRGAAPEAPEVLPAESEWAGGRGCALCGVGTAGIRSQAVTSAGDPPSLPRGGGGGWRSGLGWFSVHHVPPSKESVGSALLGKAGKQASRPPRRVPEDSVTRTCALRSLGCRSAGRFLGSRGREPDSASQVLGCKSRQTMPWSRTLSPAFGLSCPPQAPQKGGAILSCPWGAATDAQLWALIPVLWGPRPCCAFSRDPDGLWQFICDS